MDRKVRIPCRGAKSSLAAACIPNKSHNPASQEVVPCCSQAISRCPDGHRQPNAHVVDTLHVASSSSLVFSSSWRGQHCSTRKNPDTNRCMPVLGTRSTPTPSGNDHQGHSAKLSLAPSDQRLQAVDGHPGGPQKRLAPRCPAVDAAVDAAVDVASSAVAVLHAKQIQAK